MLYLTRRLKLEFFPGCQGSIFEQDCCLIKSTLLTQNDRRTTTESLLCSKGKPLVKVSLIGGALPLKLELNQKMSEEVIEFSNDLRARNFDILKIFADAISNANGDSYSLVEMNKLSNFDERRIEDYSRSLIQHDSSFVVLSTTSDEQTRPIGGGLPCIRHRLLYHAATKRYSAVIHYSLRAEGPPGRVHGGAITETTIDMIALVAQHIIGAPVDIKKLQVRVASVDVEMFGAVTLNGIVQLPDIKYERKGNMIEFTTTIEEAGKIMCKLIQGVVEVNENEISSKL